MSEANHSFVNNLNVYQGNNQKNVDVHPRVRGLTTTQRYVANSILKTQIENDPIICRYLFLHRRYASPQLLEIMTSG